MCNLKSNKTLKEILEYKKELANINLENTELVLFPSSIYLSFFYNVSYKLGSQNLSIFSSGSHTGEILASQLKSMRVTYSLINHAETKETLENNIKKIQNATKEKIKVVLCFGEKEHKTMEETIIEMRRELIKILSFLSKDEMENILFAYEPSWIINGKDIISTDVLETIIKNLKKEIETRYHFVPKFLYGGGITVKNIAKLTKIDILDGVLLGNCANNPENICKVLNKF